VQDAVGRSGSGDLAAPAAAPAAGPADHGLGLLADLPRGQRARLVALTLDPALVQRLGALGLQPGRVWCRCCGEPPGPGRSTCRWE
jgi:hypothetical protein